MYQKFIHDYLEGNLSKEEVDFLFAQLPNDNDLKQEFESQQDLLNLIKQDKINTTTPVGLTASLFSKLNYAIPFDDSKILSKNKNYRWVYSALLLLLFVVSIPLTVYFTENDNILENSIKSNIIINKSQIDKNYNIPVLMNQNLTNNEIDNKVKDNFYYQQNLLLSDKHLSNKQNLIKNEQNYNDKLVNNSFLKIQQVNHSYFINSKNENLSIFFNNFVKIDNKINNKILMDNVLELNNLYKLKNLEIYFDFKNNLNNEPNIKLNNSSSNLTNLNLGLKYKLTENSKIGFEIGQENFTQNFRTFDGLIYQQSPNLLYLGLNYTYLANFIELPTDATPYAQISALATTIGPIFKINSGFSLFANNNFSINLGIEYLSLFYNVNSNIYNSSKINVAGGLVFKF